MDTLHCTFNGRLENEGGSVGPMEGRHVQYTTGRQGAYAAVIERPARLAYPADMLNPGQFTVTLRVKHPKPLNDYFYRRLTYLYHETSDMKNRIGIQKREGSNSFVFFLSDAQGNARGRLFGGDWFSMATGPIECDADSWHEIVCTADKDKGMAQFFIDGVKVAQAEGTEFPERIGEMVWIGSEQGHSWMRGAIDELRVEPVSHLSDAPCALSARSNPLPPARRIPGRSVQEITGKELTANIDFFDICITTDAWDLRDSEAEMDRLMALCSHFGHDRVFFRVSVCGSVCYHTKVMLPADESVFSQYEGQDRCLADAAVELPRMAAVMREIDPLACAAKYAHKHGMTCYAWVTSFDSLGYVTDQEFFQRHPEYTWVSRNGKEHVPGVPCYAYPEVRKYRLDQVRELCDYDIDGILFSPRSHSPWPGRRSGGSNEGARGYGFNEPVVEAYKAKYGKDPRESEPDSLDELRFVRLKADFYTQFLREARQIAAPKGKKLAMVVWDRPADGTTVVDPVRAEHMVIDAETLAREGIVDELCVTDGPAADLNRYRLLSDGNVRVTTWGGIPGKTYEICLERMRRGCRALLNNPTAVGGTFQELFYILHFDLWEEAILDTLAEWRGTPSLQS